MDSILKIIPEFFSPTLSLSAYENIIPYLILLINFILFKLLRSFSDALFDNQIGCWWWANYINVSQSQRQNNKTTNRGVSTIKRLLKLLIGELISTCELCADCAELNVVYEKHGSYAYAAGLFLLSYLWIDSFGDAQTTPGYLFEEFFLIKGPQKLLTSGETYARFIGQSLALPLAWRFASFYWRYHLLPEHKEILKFENCKSALTTSTIKGFCIEFSCCLLCRLIELIGHKILDERKSFSNKRLVSVVVSFSCTLLVMLALELSGGYFNPILAASLEYGCKGILFYQHAIVFWFGPLTGHVLARLIYRRFIGVEQTRPDDNLQQSENKQTNEQQLITGTKDKTSKSDGRPRRTTSQRRKRHRD